MKRLGMAVLLILCSFMLIGNAHALNFGSPWVNIEAFDIDLSDINANLPVVSDVDSWEITGWGYVDINPVAGTFTDYIVYRITGWTDQALQDVTPNTLGDDFEMTLEAKLTGTVDFTASADNFTFTNMNNMDIWLDHIWDADGLTLGDFQTDLADYLDGTSVIQAGTLVDPNNGEGNTGSLPVLEGVEGSYNVAFTITDLFGILEVGGVDLNDIWDVLAWDADGDISRTPEEGVWADIAQQFRDEYGLGDPDQGDFVYALVSERGSIDTAAVPEPTTMLLLGTGLLGIVAFRRRMTKKKD
jgi:hypothetical protein